MAYVEPRDIPYIESGSRYRGKTHPNRPVPQTRDMKTKTEMLTEVLSAGSAQQVADSFTSAAYERIDSIHTEIEKLEEEKAKIGRALETYNSPSLEAYGSSKSPENIAARVYIENKLGGKQEPSLGFFEQGPSVQNPKEPTIVDSPVGETRGFSRNFLKMSALELYDYLMKRGGVRHHNKYEVRDAL